METKTCGTNVKKHAGFVNEVSVFLGTFTSLELLD